MISTSDVIEIHEILIREFGGANGLRDKSALDSALARPFQTFDNSQLYPSILEKAAALIESLLVNHPFIDGNKRTGYTVLRLYLFQYGIDLLASSENKYEFIINIASGTLKFAGIVEWLKQNTQ
jgi:death on curing protein